MAAITHNPKVGALAEESDWLAAHAVPEGAVAGVVPIGAILMWSGAIATIPTPSWQLCDGTANSPGPDLRDKFVVGARMTLLAEPRIVTDPEAVLRPLRMPLRLDIGGAAVPYAPDEYTTVDLYGEPDVRGDILALPFVDEVADRIWCSHVLEHLAVAEVPVALGELLRVLVPGGRAIIRVPNFDYVAKYWLTGPDRAWAEAMVFGLQSGPGEFHRSAFTAAILEADLRAAGFDVLRVEIRWTHNQETLQAVARKPR